MTKKSEIINTAKDIIARTYDVDKKKIANDISFRDRILKFDALDKLELLMEMEKQYNIFIEETVQFERSKTLNEFCSAFFKFVNPDIANIKTADDVFKYVKKYLLDKYEIINARITDNLFIDLHFSDIDRSELIEWAEDTFNITLPRTYFLNMHDFCSNVLQCLPKKEIVKQPQNKIQMIFAKVKQLVK